MIENIHIDLDTWKLAIGEYIPLTNATMCSYQYSGIYAKHMFLGHLLRLERCPIWEKLRETPEYSGDETDKFCRQFKYTQPIIIFAESDQEYPQDGNLVKLFEEHFTRDDAIYGVKVVYSTHDYYGSNIVQKIPLLTHMKLIRQDATEICDWLKTHN